MATKKEKKEPTFKQKLKVVVDKINSGTVVSQLDKLILIREIQALGDEASQNMAIVTPDVIKLFDTDELRAALVGSFLGMQMLGLSENLN